MKTYMPLSTFTRPQFHRLLLGAIAASALASCGGNTEPEGRTATTTFVNLTPLQPTRVVVEDGSGKQLYESPVACASGQPCSLVMANYEPPSSLQFKLYNAKGQLVSYSQTFSTDRDYFTVQHRDVMLGAHLFDGLAKAEGMDPAHLAVKLDGLFAHVDSPDGTSDQFEELGMLYAKLRAERGYDEARFYTEVHARLNSNYVLPPAFFGAPAPVAASPATAKEQAKCPSWLAAVTKIAGDYGKYIPYVGNDVGKFIGKSVSAATEAACDESSEILDQISKVNEKLDEIKAQLDVIDKKIDVLGFKIDDIKMAVGEVLRLSAVLPYKQAQSDLEADITTYGNVLGNSRRTNLVAYVEGNGGLASFNNDTAMGKMLRNIASQKANLSKMADRDVLSAMATYLSTSCGRDYTQLGASDDVVAVRAKCNLMLTRMTTEFSETQRKAALLLKDEIMVIHRAIQAARDPESLRRIYVSPFPGVDWDQAQAEVNKLLQSNLDTFAQVLGSRHIELVSGMPAGIVYGVLFDASCRDASNAPTINAWYPNLDKPFVTTYCYNGGRYVKSRHYYDKAGAGTVAPGSRANVLGVVVNKERTDVTDRSTPWQQAGIRGYTTAIPSDPQTRGLAFKLDPQRFTVSNADYPPKWVLETGATTQYLENCWSTFTGQCEEFARSGQFRYVLKQEPATGDGYSYFTSRHYETSWDNGASNRGHVTSDKKNLFATFAYTLPRSGSGDDDMTLVWQVELAGGGAGKGAFYNNWRLRCITADCSVSGDALNFDTPTRTRTVSVNGGTAAWKSFTVR